jgi:preprotein translocase SecE subunit
VARRGNSRSSADDESGSGTAVAEKERHVSRVSAAGSDKPDKAAPAVAGARRGFFDIYKPGQGYHTRLGTALGMGALTCWFAYFLFEKLSVIDAGTATKLIRVGIPVAVLMIFGLLGYWALALNHRICDFLIATEGEMKKVNWSTRKDIIGSTKVVVLVVIFMSILLFIVDIFFMSFFSAIGILRTGGGMMEALRSLF